MTKLVLFVALILSVASVMALNVFKDLEVSNTKFSYAKFQKELDLIRNPPVEVAKTEEEVSDEPVELVLDTEELKRGYEIYNNVGKCVTCHGDKGQGNAAEEGPAIAGQFDWYIVDQLGHFKSGRRSNPKMLPYLKNLSAKDISDVAHYLSKLRWNQK